MPWRSFNSFFRSVCYTPTSTSPPCPNLISETPAVRGAFRRMAARLSSTTSSCSTRTTRSDARSSEWATTKRPSGSSSWSCTVRFPLRSLYLFTQSAHHYFSFSSFRRGKNRQAAGGRHVKDDGQVLAPFGRNVEVQCCDPADQGEAERVKVDKMSFLFPPPRFSCRVQKESSFSLRSDMKTTFQVLPFSAPAQSFLAAQHYCSLGVSAPLFPARRVLLTSTISALGVDDDLRVSAILRQVLLRLVLLEFQNTIVRGVHLPSFLSSSSHHDSS